MKRMLLVLLLAGCASQPVLPRHAVRGVIHAHEGRIHALLISPDGTLVASAGERPGTGSDEITLWATATGARVRSLAGVKGVLASMAFSPDGKALAAGAADGRIAILDAETGVEKISFTGLKGSVDCLTYSFDGTVLVSVTHQEGEKDIVEVRRWDVKTGGVRDHLVVNALSVFTLSPDGDSLVWPATGEISGVRHLDLETKKEALLSRVAVAPGDPLVYSPDGKWLAAVHLEDWNPLPNHCPYVYMFSAQTGKVRLRSPRTFDACRGLAVSHDSRLLARGVDAGIQLLDLKTIESHATAGESPEGIEGAALLAFTPDDQTIVSADGRGRILLWDVARLLEVRKE